MADVDAQTLTKLVKFLKRGKAPGPDTIHNEVLRLGTTTSLFHHLARLFTSSIQLGYIPTGWKLVTLRMLLKPDKPITLTTRPISLISSIMKLFERVLEQRLRSHLEHIGFINKHQSGFRRAKSTDDHLFRLSQSIMESFNRGEHAVAAFLDETLKIYPQVKFLGIIFDSKLTFQPHFEDILERCNSRYYRLRLLVNKKWGPSPATLIQIYKQCVRPIF